MKAEELKTILSEMKGLVDLFDSHNREDVKDFINLISETYNSEQLATYLVLSISIFKKMLPEYVNTQTKLAALGKLLSNSGHTAIAQINSNSMEDAVKNFERIVGNVKSIEEQHKKDLVAKVKRYLAKLDDKIDIEAMFSNIEVNLDKDDEEIN